MTDGFVPIRIAHSAYQIPNQPTTNSLLKNPTTLAPAGKRFEYSREGPSVAAIHLQQKRRAAAANSSAAIMTFLKN